MSDRPTTKETGDVNVSQTEPTSTAIRLRNQSQSTELFETDSETLTEDIRDRPSPDRPIRPYDPGYDEETEHNVPQKKACLPLTARPTSSRISRQEKPAARGTML